jgi:hypothetical protein
MAGPIASGGELFVPIVEDYARLCGVPETLTSHARRQGIPEGVRAEERRRLEGNGKLFARSYVLGRLTASPEGAWLSVASTTSRR